MSELEQALADYLQLRHSLGHQLADAGRLLPRLVAHLDAQGLPMVTVEVALEWAQQAPDSPSGRVTSVGLRRMTAVRGFARYLSGIDPNTQVPPLGLMPSQRRWRPPFIFCPADIAVVLGQVRESSFAPLCAATYDTLIGLLAVSGLRIGEAIKLPLSKYAVLRDELTATAQGSELLRLLEAQAAALRRRATDLLAAHRHRRDRGGRRRNVPGGSVAPNAPAA